MVTCCSLPLKSVKRRSTHFTSFSLIRFRVFSDIVFLQMLVQLVSGRPRLAMLREEQTACHVANAAGSHRIGAAAAATHFLCTILNHNLNQDRKSTRL